MHHDEFPVGKDWVNRLLIQLSELHYPDVFLMPCILMSEANKRARFHMPQLIQSLILRYWPSYLFRRNVIGPTSCVVALRELYPAFDESLCWLVDVDLYWRLYSKKYNFEISKNLQVASTINRDKSITHSLGDQIGVILKTELRYMSKKYPQCHIWLNSQSHRFIFFIEASFWSLFKLCYVTYGSILSFFTTRQINLLFKRK